MIFQDCLGIDIRKGHISAVYVKSSFKGIELTAQDTWDFAEDDRPSMVAENINSFMDENDARPVEVYLGIPSEHLMIKHLSFPSAVKENLRDTLRYEMEKILPINPNDIVYDYLIKDSGPVTVDIVLVVLKKKDVEFYMELASHIKNGVTALTISSFVLNDYLSRTCSGNQKGACFVIRPTEKDIEFSVVSEKEIAAGALTSGAAVSENLPDSVKKIIESDIRNDSLRLIECNLQGSPRTDLGDLAEYLQPADFAENGVSSINHAGAYALACLMNAKDDVLNFLPLKMRRKKDLTPVKYLAVISVVLVISLGFYFGALFYKKNSILKYYEKEISGLKEKSLEVEKMIEEADVLDKKVEELKLIFAQRPRAIEIAREITTVLPANSWIKQLNIKGGGIEIQGVSSTSSSLVPLLENSPLFSDVKFLSPITKDKDGNDLFRIGLKVENTNKAGQSK